MTSRSRLFPVLIVLVLVSSACVAPIQPTAAESVSAPTSPPPLSPHDCLVIAADDSVIRAPCGGEAIPYTPDDVAAACTHIYPLNPDQAYANTRMTGDVAVWTFGINFDLLNAAGAPIGCLTLLRSSDAASTFVPIDRGGILVDTCTTTTTLPPVQDGVATFDGSNDVTCSMNLGAWLKDPTLQAWVEDSAGELDGAELARRLDSAIPESLIVEYRTYALAAALIQAAPPPCAAATECLLPIFHLDPDPAADGPFIWHWLDVLAHAGGESFTFPVDRQNCVEPADWSRSAEPALIWRNVPPVLPAPFSGMEYLYRRAAGQVQVVCYEPGYSGFVPFWLGPSVLSIGRKRDSGEMFYGQLDGILIGPPDSKPPA